MSTSIILMSGCGTRCGQNQELIPADSRKAQDTLMVYREQPEPGLFGRTHGLISADRTVPLAQNMAG